MTCHWIRFTNGDAVNMDRIGIVTKGTDGSMRLWGDASDASLAYTVGDKADQAKIDHFLAVHDYARALHCCGGKL